MPVRLKPLKLRQRFLKPQVRPRRSLSAQRKWKKQPQRKAQEEQAQETQEEQAGSAGSADRQAARQAGRQAGTANRPLATEETTDAEVERTSVLGQREAEDTCTARTMAENDMPVDEGMRLAEPEPKKQRPDVSGVEGNYEAPNQHGRLEACWSVLAQSRVLGKRPQETELARQSDDFGIEVGTQVRGALEDSVEIFSDSSAAHKMVDIQCSTHYLPTPEH
eukprot:1127378-Amphidinium_carterae.3